MLGQGRATTGRPKKGDQREGRGRKLCIRISDSDLKKLEKVCSEYGISKTDFLISAIEDAYFRVKKLKL